MTMVNVLTMSRRRVLTAEGILISAFIVIFVFFSVASPVFFTTANLQNIGRQTALVSIVAVGMTFVIVAGEFDLSVGSTLALAGVMSALAMKWVFPSFVVGAACLAHRGYHRPCKRSHHDATANTIIPNNARFSQYRARHRAARHRYAPGRDYEPNLLPDIR